MKKQHKNLNFPVVDTVKCCCCRLASLKRACEEAFSELLPFPGPLSSSGGKSSNWANQGLLLQLRIQADKEMVDKVAAQHRIRRLLKVSVVDCLK